MMKYKNQYHIVSYAVIAILADQISKLWAAHYATPPIQLISNILSFRLETNTGIALSIPLPLLYQLLISLIVIPLITWFLYRTLDIKNKTSQIVIALFAAGALGNFLDRLRLNHVIDFISVGTFPVFNLADIYLSVAVFILLLFYDKISRPTK